MYTGLQKQFEEIKSSEMPTSKFQWNVNQNSNSFTQENAFERAVCEMAAILSQCVNMG